MFVLQSFVVGLAGIASTALAAPSFVAKREIAAITADFNYLDTVISWNLGNITLYKGGLDFTVLTPLITASNLLDTAISRTTTDVNAHEAFSVEDSAAVLARTSSSTVTLVDTLNALLAKASLFRAALINRIVYDSLVTHKTYEDALYAALVAKSQPDDATATTTLKAYLASVYNTVVAAYA